MMTASGALAVVASMIMALGEGCPTHHNGNSYVCKGEEACIRWKRAYREEAATKILVFHPDGTYIITQDWKGAQTIHDGRASLKWIKDGTGDLIEFRLKNTTLKDDGVYLKMVYLNDDDYRKERKRLRVLRSCPALAMYAHPRVSYKTGTSNATEIYNILARIEPGNVTIWVTIPAADPPVQATVSSGQYRKTCMGEVGIHSQCEVVLQFDKPGELQVNVTLAFVAWTSITREVYILTKERQAVIPLGTPPEPRATDFKMIVIIVLAVFSAILIVTCVILCCRSSR